MTTSPDKTCSKCGQEMVVLFQVDFYCPSCEGKDPSKDEWEIEFRSMKDCPHPVKDAYVHDRRVFCRSCGQHLRTI